MGLFRLGKLKLKKYVNRHLSKNKSYYMESKYRLFVLSKAAEWRIFMKKGYSAIKRFHQIYEVEVAVLAVTAVYLSMLLAIFFWFFQFKNADLKDIAACRMWDRKVSIQAIILFLVMTIMIGFAFYCVLFLIKLRHIQEDKISADRKKTGNFFRTYIKELVSAYMLSASQTILFFHLVRYLFLEAETEIMDLIIYKQLVFDYHVKMFCGCNIALVLLIFPNLAYVVKVRRNENIVKILLEMKKCREKTKKQK